ncbi:ArnT family glycosyltransferase [Catellatospora coxensis]|uniref:Membrane protein n=1 Tax=Catellatospora coxensis TaxID=310354 RepID=A0A8J3KR51_9ACTN|nr:hypothetical protein [Catellatospora coxensis]GIG04582.1 membrane protein [Catellatospora coxensis]
MSEISSPSAPAQIRPAGWPGAVRRSLAAAWPALVAYAAARTSGLVVLFLWAHATGKDAVGLLGTRSDAAHYVEIATHGYPSAAEIHTNTMAFFPLHPTLTRWLGAILPFGLPTVGVLLTWVMALVAAWGLFAIGNHLHDRRTGVLLATVWGLLPHAIVESMGYTEAMFTAFAAWTLLATLRRQWVAAALLSVLAGLTRPSASALFPVVVLAAFVAIVRRQDRSWRAWFALLVAPLGWLGYLGWVANRTGRLDGWFHLQHEGWGSSWDAGRYTASMTASVLAEAKVPDYLLVALVMLVSLALFAISVIDRQPWQLLMFSALMIAVSLGGSGFYNAKARFLLPAFALLLPVAGALARTKPAKMYVIVGTLAAVSAYCGGYLLLIWKFSP